MHRGIDNNLHDLRARPNSHVHHMFELSCSTNIADFCSNLALEHGRTCDEFRIPLQLDQPMVAHFTGRETYLNHLNEMIALTGAIPGKSLTNIVVVLASGGMGKTQLVLQYIYRHLKLFSAVFWVNASSLETTQTSFINIAEQLIKHYAKTQTESYFSIARRLDLVGLVDERGHITLGENSPSLVVKAVKSWLALDGNYKWLIVFDNVDDLESFNVSDSFPYKHSIGNVIVTTRRRDCMDYGKGFELKEMEESEGVELLLKIFNTQTEDVGSEGVH
jgi:hypothetical protein